MPATINSYRGDSVAKAKIVNVTIVAPVLPNQIYSVWCNLKGVSYTAVAGDTISTVAAGLAAALQAASTIPEFNEFLATSAGAVVTLTAATPGVPFDVAVTSSANVIVTETTPGKNAVNEQHSIALVGTYTGGTFTITYTYGTTGAIAYNATAATVQAAIAALAGVGAGQVIVTGGPGPGTAWLVDWTGTLAGTSIAVGTINGASLTGNGGVTITHTQPGAGPSNAIQQIDLSGATSGTFTLTFAGQTTNPLNWGSTTVSQLQTALQGLSTIGSGNCTAYGCPSVTGGNHNTYYVVFAGALAGAAQSLITINGSNLIGQGTTQTVQAGGTTTAGYQLVDLGFGASGTFSLTYAGNTTAAIPVTPGSAQGSFATNVQAALAALPSPNVLAVYAGTFLVGVPSQQALIKFGSTTPAAVPVLTINSAGLTGGSPAVTVLSDGRANLNDVQQVYVTATGGTFTLTCNSQTTGAIAWNATGATVLAAIDAAFTSTLTTTTCTGSGTLASPWIVTTTVPAATLIPTMTGSGASLTGGGGTITELAAGAAGVNEVQLVTLAAGVTAGTFTLAFLSVATAGLAWNASAATLQTALRALSTIGAGNVNVTGSAGGPWTVTYVSALANAPQPFLVGDGSLLVDPTTTSITLATSTWSTGPHHYDDPANWTLGHVPNTLDALVFDLGSSDCLYGLNQIAVVTASVANNNVTWALGAGGSAGNGYTSGSFVAGQTVYLSNAGGALPTGISAGTLYYLVNVNRDAGTAQLSLTAGGAPITISGAGTGTQTMGARLASIEETERFGGAIGLPRVNAAGYIEYRPRYLHIGLATIAQTGLQTVTIGNDAGRGAGKTQIDNDVDAAFWTIVQTGGSFDSEARDVLLKGTNASNTLEQISGDVGVGFFEGETTALASVKLRGGTLELGPGLTMTGPVTRTGGTLICDGATINGTVTM